jgi:hypothetical protein
MNQQNVLDTQYDTMMLIHLDKNHQIQTKEHLMFLDEFVDNNQ